jgi:uncharacterized OB-fold protein
VSDWLYPQPVGIPLPEPTHVSKPYWDAARERRLIYQRCTRCRDIPRLPVRICGACGHPDPQWETSSKRGHLYSWTVVWRPQHPSFRVPYAPAVMAVDEGWWLMTSVVDCAPEDLTDGIELEVVFHPAGGGVQLPYARPVSR